MKARWVVSILAVVVVFGGVTASTQAAWGPYFAAYGFGNGPYPPYCCRDIDRLPYFALYPPVYYTGYIQPRDYGQSPFAYPPIPPAVDAEPMAAAPTASPRPLKIMNPFVTPPQEVSRPASAPKGATPLVVYPAGNRAGQDSVIR